jgi:hypothetical protein
VTGHRQVLCGQPPYWDHLGNVIQAILEGVRPNKPDSAAALGFTDGLWWILQSCWEADRGLRARCGNRALSFGSCGFGLGQGTVTQGDSSNLCCQYPTARNRGPEGCLQGWDWGRTRSDPELGLHSSGSLTTQSGNVAQSYQRSLEGAQMGKHTRWGMIDEDGASRKPNVLRRVSRETYGAIKNAAGVSCLSWNPISSLEGGSSEPCPGLKKIEP